MKKKLLLLLIILLYNFMYARTLVVEKGGNGEFFYLRNATIAAKNGDVIIVRPGIYYENATIRINGKNIDIVGAGYDSTKIIYTGDWVPFYFKDVSNCKLSGIDICSMYDKSQTLILIQHSDVIIENNKIHNSHNLHGISIIDTSNPVIRNNIISENEETGINISCSNGEIYNNEIYSNKLYGISVSDSSNIAITNNKVYNNKHTGIIIVNSKANLKGNECYNNKRDGITSNGSSLNIIGNKVHTNKQAGIFIFNSKANTSENECYNNKLHGISIEHSDFDISKNRTYHNKQVGILLIKSNGNIYENVIYENELHGISVTKNSKPSIYNNTIYNNKSVGIKISKKSNPTIKNNIIVENIIGISVIKASSAKLIKNLVWGNTNKKQWNYGGKNYNGIAKGKTDICADPLFVDKKSYNFLLKPKSPAIGVGEDNKNLGAFIHQDREGVNTDAESIKER